MAFIAGIDSWRETLAQGFPGRMQAAFQASARNSLLKQINTVLLVHNSRLYDLHSGSWRTLENIHPGAVEIADAASDLLPVISDHRAVLLLLPPHEFLSTTVTMPGVARESMRAALELQAHALLPNEEDLTLAVNTDEHEGDAPDVALWMTARRLNGLFDAFSARGMLLASVMPRLLVSAGGFGHVLVEDNDDRAITRVHMRNGAVLSWMQVSHLDLEEDAFRQQWDALGAALPDDVERLEFASADDYIALAGQVVPDRHYSFVPAGAEAHKDQLQKGKRLGMFAAAAAVLVFLAFIPFIVQSIQARLLLSELEETRQMAATARADQARVREFEQEWGAFVEFPRQNLSDTLLTLQEIISPGVLTSLEIEEGFATLEGDSPDPQSLLQRLEAHEMFTEVDFARATNNQRYFIELRLATVDFPAYQQWYFPDAR